MKGNSTCLGGTCNLPIPHHRSLLALGFRQSKKQSLEAIKRTISRGNQKNNPHVVFAIRCIFILGNQKNLGNKKHNLGNQKNNLGNKKYIQDNQRYNIGNRKV